MQFSLNFAKNRLHQPLWVAVWLLLLSVVLYGLFIPWLHLYIDDWIWVWTWERLGRAGLVRYFATNRPLWGLIFQVTMPLFSHSVLAGQLFALLVRWSSAWACWWLIRLVWPNRSPLALLTGLLFLAYPGFALQPIAITYGHLFLIYTAFLLSLCLNIVALRAPARSKTFWAATSAALLLAMVNLLTLEYFFALELARPVLLWLADAQSNQTPRASVRAAMLHWSPYLALFIAVVIWRTFFFSVQTHNYALVLPSNLRAHPLPTLANLALTIAADGWKTTLGAWLPAIQRLRTLNLRMVNSQVTVVAAGIAALLTLAGLFGLSTHPRATNRWQSLVMGLLLLGLAGWPFWLTGLNVQPVGFSSRLTLPFALGAALSLASLLDGLRPRRIGILLAALAVGLAGGYHFQIANDFRLEWQQNRQLMWQIAWRIPQLKEGTTLLLTDFPVTYYNTATLATELNALYPPQARFPDLGSYVLYAREVDRDLGPQGLRAGQAIHGSNVSAQFQGSTDQVLAAQYDLSRCFRLLDPAIDAADETLSLPMQRAAQLTQLRWVQTDDPTAVPDLHLFGDEPAHIWCYYFEKADLARQSADWQTAARLGGEALTRGLTPRDDMERLVFIEAFAHTDQWNAAAQLTEGFTNAEKRPMLCRAWQGILQNTPPSTERETAWRAAKCPLQTH